MGRCVGVAVVLLTPHRQLAVLVAHLGDEDTLHTLIERIHAALAQLFVGQSLVVTLLLGNIAQEHHGVIHSAVVERDMLLISVRVRPELRPATVLVLSAEEIPHSAYKSFLVSRILRCLIHPRQIAHLHIGGAIVGGGVIAARLVSHHLLALLIAQGAAHVDVLRPTAGDALVEQHLIGNGPRLITLVEGCLLLRRKVPATVAQLSIGTDSHNEQYSHDKGPNSSLFHVHAFSVASVYTKTIIR